MTNRQLEVLDYIKRFIATKGYSPTVREIASGLDLKSPSTVQEHLQKLVKNGLITIDQKKSRTIELLVQNEYLNKNDRTAVLPILNNEYARGATEFLEVPIFMLNNYDSKSLYAFKSEKSIYIVNAAMGLKDRPSLTIMDGIFRIEEVPHNEIFGNIISEFKIY